jgi:hypothetical protein
MRPQDLTFIVVFVYLLFKRKPEWFVLVGITCLIVSIPLFYFWVFFTAQRLTYYAAGFFTIAALMLLIKKSDK